MLYLKTSNKILFINISDFNFDNFEFFFFVNCTTFQKAPTYTIGKRLVDKVNKAKVIPYACIEGHVAPVLEVLQSHYGPEEGVIRHTLLTEHKSKRQAGYW